MNVFPFYRWLRGGKWEGWNIADPIHSVIWFRVREWSETPPPGARGNPSREEYNSRVMPYLLYARYVLRHCWYVRKMCWKNGLYWQGIVHDLSKWRPSEFIPYAQYFYWSRKQKDAETFAAFAEFGCAEAAPYGFFFDDRFNYAWLHHQNRNPHHWQYWVLQQDSGEQFPLPMPEKYVKEMICDWWGASVATGNKGKSKDWYEKNKEHTKLHPETRAYFEKAIRNSEAPYVLPPYNSFA